MADDKGLDCFSIRHLSPFRGTLHIVESPGAQAVTADGLSWRIQVRATVTVKGWGSLDRSGSEQRIVIYGFWSKAGGFQGLPLNPLVDLDEVQSLAKEVLDALSEYASALPYPARDNIELWLLDKDSKLPLALLASRQGTDELPMPRRLKWVPTEHSELGFAADSLLDNTDSAEAHPTHKHRDVLAECVKRAAGSPPQAQWFERSPEGGGLGLADNLNDAAIRERTLRRADFPQLLIREAWDDTQCRDLVADYIRWQAPLLLTLQGISRETRARLEQLARTSALKVEHFHRLYPEIVDQQQMNAMLVEARMRQAAGERVG